MNVRRLAPSDADDVARIASGGWMRWPVTEIRATMSQRHFVGWAADSDKGGMLGYVLTWHVLGEAEILDLTVDPAARRSGWGRRLVAAVQSNGASIIWLDVAADNGPALALYRDLGFVEASRRPAYYASGADALVMRWPE